MPAGRPKEPVFAGGPPEPIAGRELVCLELGREFCERTGPNSRTGIGGGAGVVFWYAYNTNWQRLRERSDWIEMGFGTPQIDESNLSRSRAELIDYIDGESGVLETAAQQPALALVVGDAGDDLLCIAR